MHRTLIARLSLALALVAPLHAAEPPATHPDPAPRAVIEKTYVLMPATVGTFELHSQTNYAREGQPMAGVGMKWIDPANRDLNADLYVFPVGEGAGVQAIEREFRASIDAARKAGLYRSVRWDEDSERALHHRDGSAWPARVLSMTAIRRSGEAIVSRTYLLHDGVYAYKLRVDLPAPRALDLPALGNALGADLLGAIQVVSVGSCGKSLQVRVLKDDIGPETAPVEPVSADGFTLTIRQSALHGGDTAHPAQDPALLALMTQAVARQIEHGCTILPFEPPAGVTAMVIDYPADFWAAAPASDPGP